MSTEITPYVSSPMSARMEYARTIAAAGDLIPRGLHSPVRKEDGTMGPPAPNPGKVLLVMETGAMLGFHPIAALSNIAVIDGKPAMSAQLMAATVRKAGVKLRVTTTGRWRDKTFEAIAELIRDDDPDFTYRVVWDYERAERAGLLNKDNWKHYGEAMCKARAISEVCREGAQDFLLGVVYTPEELGATVDESGAVIEAENRPLEAPEASRDWAAAFANARTSAEVAALMTEAKSLGELNDRLQAVAMARGGVLHRAEQATEEMVDAEVVEATPAEEAEMEALRARLSADRSEPAEPTLEDLHRLEAIKNGERTDSADDYDLAAEEFERAEAARFAAGEQP